MGKVGHRKWRMEIVAPIDGKATDAPIEIQERTVNDSDKLVWSDGRIAGGQVRMED